MVGKGNAKPNYNRERERARARARMSIVKFSRNNSYEVILKGHPGAGAGTFTFTIGQGKK